jgi:hypothetical protein
VRQEAKGGHPIMPKCNHPNGIIIKPDGVNELDPCVYEEIERYENVTVIISKCIHCGELDISWVRQDNTRKVDIEKEE